VTLDAVFETNPGPCGKLRYVDGRDRDRLPLVEVEIPAGCTNDVYEQRLGQALVEAPLREAHTIAFGDLFLAPIFSQPVACRTGRVVRRDGFVFCDVLPQAG
jgi:hypothetical protein